jgi:hypothetical protein
MTQYSPAPCETHDGRSDRRADLSLFYAGHPKRLHFGDNWRKRVNESLARLLLAYVTVGVITSLVSGSVTPLLVCILVALTCCWIACRFLR